MTSSLGLGRDGDDAAGLLVPVPQRWVSASRRCSETPLWEASDEVERWASTLTWLAGGPARGELARGSLQLIFPFDGAD
jgi:hypothetical protein